MVAENLSIRWSPPPDPPVPTPGHIDIWSLPLDTLPCRPELLEPSEAERLQRYRDPPGRRQYCASRTGLRNVLAAYLACRPREVPLQIKPGGKPRLAPEPPPLYFNLSHAGQLALLAVCADHKVGVDLEGVRAIPNPQAVARRIFSPEEQRVLAQSNWNRHTFYALWTALEARQKCLGRGVFGKPATEDEVSSRIFQLDRDHCAAIAWPGAMARPELRFYRL